MIIIIPPISKLNNSYFRKSFKYKKLQLFIPPKRIQLEKNVDSVKLPEIKRKVVILIVFIVVIKYVLK